MTPPEVAEVVERFTEMDRRSLLVMRLHRCIRLLWLPVAGIILMAVALVCYASNAPAGVAWSALGGASIYFVVTVGEELCAVALQLLQRNLDDCKAFVGIGGDVFGEATGTTAATGAEWPTSLADEQLAISERLERAEKEQGT